MKHPITVKLDIPYKSTLLSFLIINLIGVIVVILIQNNLPPELPLFYGLPKGQSQLAPKIYLATPLVAATFISIVNTILIKFVKDTFSQRALVYLTVAASLLAITTVVKISLLVGSF